MTLEKYTTEVKTEFVKLLKLSDDKVDAYFKEKDTKDYILLAYKHFESGNTISNAYNPRAVASCLNMLY